MLYMDMGIKMKFYEPVMTNLRVGLYRTPYYLKHTPGLSATTHALER